jgi:hypothetical protein
MKLLPALLCLILSLPAQAQLRPGEAELSLPDGGVYRGPLKDGKADGIGYVRYATGAQYEGSLKAGVPEGQGKSTSPIGDVYEGQWKNGKRHGTGKLAYRLGGSYEGEWREGFFHGKGVLTYAGSGRRHAARFDHGIEEGAAVNVAAEQRVTSYRLIEEAENSGRRQLLYGGYYPQDMRYGEMNGHQRSGVRAAYGAALASADEPPFPLDGMRQVATQISQEHNRTRQAGLLRLIVQVNADGTPSGVTIFTSPSPQMEKFVTEVFTQQRFKPALCDGLACAIPFFYQVQLNVP